jgi:uncharacterized protein (TIGR02145 family)
MPTTAVSLRATFEEVIPNPSILYFKGSGANTTLEVGTWGIEITADNYASVMAFFKFGSVVGFDLTGTVTGSMTAVKFNPSTVTPTDYGTIPVYAAADYSNNILDVSASTWHNSTNVPLGKGDPCRLVGLTAAQVKAGSIDSGQYRLPTDAENQAFLGSTTSQTAGSAYYTVSGGWVSTTNPGVGTFPVGGISLPAAGRRDYTTGSVSNQGSAGRYWSSTVRDSTLGYRLSFGSSSVSPSGTASYSYGFAVRCVRR